MSIIKKIQSYIEQDSLGKTFVYYVIPVLIVLGCLNIIKMLSSEPEGIPPILGMFLLAFGVLYFNAIACIIIKYHALTLLRKWITNRFILTTITWLTNLICIIGGTISTILTFVIFGGNSGGTIVGMLLAMPLNITIWFY